MIFAREDTGKGEDKKLALVCNECVAGFAFITHRRYNCQTILSACCKRAQGGTNSRQFILK
ncbi:hypothetical protein DIU36_26495 [Mucilaginibacter rubeus]|nr:hypothetical protein DIU36_26495 [Mucilaginibacter rubeus]